MKITKRQLQKIISEEIERSLNEQGIDMPNIYHARHSGQWPKDVEEDFDKEQAKLAQTFTNNPVYDLVSIFDLTGVMSWPSLAEAIVNLPDNPSKKDLAILTICILAVIPLIGRGTKFIKGYNLWSDIVGGVSKTKGMTKFLRKSGNLMDDFIESSPSMKVAVDDILKRSNIDFLPEIREKLINAAKLIDDTQVIQWLHKKTHYMGNIADEVMIRLLDQGNVT